VCFDHIAGSVENANHGILCRARKEAKARAEGGK
jgi:hypothetical protein